MKNFLLLFTGIFFLASCSVVNPDRLHKEETMQETLDKAPYKKVIACDYLVRALEEDRDTFQAGNTTIYIQDRYEPLSSPQTITLYGKANNLHPWQGLFVDKWEISQKGNLLIGFYTKDFEAARILPCRLVKIPIDRDEPVRPPKKN